ncbi:hypothetical protein DOY81_003965 [Sarcophaga bullata]|nr:hypothetical protein DOY81_003965 [Sarcophaga bullata]
MAFNTEIQSSHSRPHTLNNNQVVINNSTNQINTNSVNGTGTTEETSPYNYDNNKFRKVGKHNIDDPGTQTTRNYRNSGGQSIIDPNSSEQFEESKQHKSENVDTNTTTKFETKNIFAYEAFEISTGSVGNSKSANPPPSENSKSDPGKYSKTTTVTDENHKNTLFTKVSSANTFSEKQYKPSAKERHDNCPTRHCSIYERQSQYGSTILPNTNSVISDNTGTNKSDESIVSYPYYFCGDQQQSKRQEYNTQEYSAENQSKRTESAIISTIDIGINGRYRVDRCRYVPFTSGYEWSNAAYCYS